MPGALQPGSDVEDARQVHGHGQHQQGQDGDHARRLQLEAPPQGLTARAQGQKRPGQDQEGRQHPGEEGQTVAAGLGRFVGRAAKRRRLHRQDGEDAGHQVQDQPAQQGEQGRLQEGGGRRGGRGLLRRLAVADGGLARSAGQGRTRIGGNLPGAEIGGQDSGQRGFQTVGGQAATGGEAQGQALRAALADLGGGVVDDPALEGEEVGPFGRGAVQRPAGGGQGQSAVGEGRAGLDPGGTGGRGDHVLHGLAVARIQRGGALAHRQVQGQVQILRHAHLVAADVEVGGDA
ncbi:hypothetical protein D3C87_1143920 [compost metagenome]